MRYVITGRQFDRQYRLEARKEGHMGIGRWYLSARYLLYGSNWWIRAGTSGYHVQVDRWSCCRWGERSLLGAAVQDMYRFIRHNRLRTVSQTEYYT